MMDGLSFQAAGFSISVQCQLPLLEEGSQLVILFDFGAWHNAHNKLSISCYREVLYYLISVIFKIK